MPKVKRFEFWLHTTFQRLMQSVLRCTRKNANRSRKKFNIWSRCLRKWNSSSSAETVGNSGVTNNPDRARPRCFLNLLKKIRPRVREHHQAVNQIDREKGVLIMTPKVSYFDHLNEALTKTPILRFPLLNNKSILYTYVSNAEVGAILSQIQEDEEKSPAVAPRHCLKLRRITTTHGNIYLKL